MHYSCSLRLCDARLWTHTLGITRPILNKLKVTGEKTAKLMKRKVKLYKQENVSESVAERHKTFMQVTFWNQTDIYWGCFQWFSHKTISSFLLPFFMTCQLASSVKEVIALPFLSLTVKGMTALFGYFWNKFQLLENDDKYLVSVY